MVETKFYEVTDSRNDAVWGGENAYDAVEWFRRTADAHVYVSVWDTQTEDFRLITDKIEVTPIIKATLLSEPFKPTGHPTPRRFRIIK